jgi:hypothetical protein
MARSTFSIFATLFALSLYLVLPNQSSRVRALVVIAAGAVGAHRTIRTWIPVGAYLFLVVAGIQQLCSADPSGSRVPWE